MSIRKAAICAILCPALAVQGCAALVGGGAGAGAVAYVQGEYRTSYPSGYDKVWNASLQALFDMKLQMVDRFRDAREGKMTARKGDGTPVDIKVAKVGAEETEVKIRIGTLGNEAESRMLDRRIAQNLGR